MGEHIRINGEDVKIGTCEDLYYTTFFQLHDAYNSGQLKQLANNDTPENYLKPDSGYRFRFPFPDEDKMSIGVHEDFQRGVPVLVSKTDYPFHAEEGPEKLFEMQIRQQKLIQREIDGKICLTVVWHNPATRESYRIENDAEVKDMLKQIVKHHISKELDPSKKNFYRQLATRILKGYRLDPQKVLLKREIKPPQKQRRTGFRKGL